MTTFIRADNFEHDSANLINNNSILLRTKQSGTPEIGSAYAKNGSFGMRCGRAGANDDLFNLPTDTSGDAGTRTTVEFWWKPVTNGTDNDGCNIIRDIGTAGVAMDLNLKFWRIAGPTYHLRHYNKDVLTLTLGNWYRIRRHCYVDGAALHSWLWVWDSSNVLQVDGDYQLLASAYATKVRHLFGTHDAPKGGVDVYLDDVVSANDLYWTTTPTFTRLTPDADDGTEDDWIGSPDAADKYKNVYETDFDSADYNYSATDDHKQLHGTDANLSADATIQGVALALTCIQVFGDATDKLYARVKDGSDVESGIISGTLGAFRGFALWMEDRPGGGAWTVAAVNSLLLGYWFFDKQNPACSMRVHQIHGLAIRFDAVTGPLPRALGGSILAPRGSVPRNVWEV